MNKVLYACLLVSSVSFLLNCAKPKLKNKNSKSEVAISQLIERILPGHSSDFICIQGPKIDTLSAYFKVYSRNQKIVLYADTPSGWGMAFNQYLRKVCAIYISKNGFTPMHLSTLPMPNDTLYGATPFQKRYFLNYCTYNYSHSFKDWAHWQHQIDWMALQGINMPLAILGNEIIWYELLLQYGVTADKAKQFIAGPAFTAWWLMGNLEGWGGPVSEAWMQEQYALQKKIINRMDSLGMTPVLQGFYGMVPNDLISLFPKAHIIKDTGNWCGGFQRPAFLDPQDPLFGQMADSYYKLMHQKYGKAQYYGGDPLHEGGKLAENINKTKAAKAIQKAMQIAAPKSTWVLQGWWENPSDSLLLGTDSAYTFVLDLWGETQPFWEKRKGFHNTPFIWCTLLNFGGKLNNWGRIDTLAAQPYRILNSTYHQLIKGIGAIPEGDVTNEVNYDFLFEQAWQTQPIQTKKWFYEYPSYRYGTYNDKASHAWQLLYTHVYNSPMGSYNGLGSTAKGFTDAGEAVSCARPAWNLKKASTWGPALGPHYPDSIMLKVVNLLLQCPPSIQQVDTYQYDVVDFVRQCISNKLWKVYQKIHVHKDNIYSAEYTSYKNEFLDLISIEDSLMSYRKETQLGTWTESAIRAATSASEANLFLYNAKLLITLWGNDAASKQLHDYAHKEWHGLLRDFYLPRWEMFFESHEKKSKPDFEKFEKNWTLSHKNYTTQPSKNPIPYIQSIQEKLK